VTSRCSVDWKEIEGGWFQSAADAIVATVASNPTERFYAGAFSPLYGDYSSILVPGFGLNSESWSRDVRWHPPDWHWSIIDEAHERVRPLYQALLALDVDGSTYEVLWERHIDLLAKVSHRLTELVRSREIAADPAAFSTGFFVGIIDFSQGDDAIGYLKRSVDAATITSSGILEEEP
jgi:hypothetical protein